MVSVKVERPPNKLAGKVSKSGGKTLKQAVAEGERAIERLSDNYRDCLADDMAALNTFMDALRADPCDGTYKNMFRLVHNMRGQAATFGFPLITEVGRSLCLYLLETEDSRDLHLDLIELHVNALRVIYREQIEGHGDSLSREVVAALMKAVETETKRHT